MNAEELKAYKRQWYLKNRERLIAKACKRQKDKADEVREAHRIYRENNRDKVRASQRAWELRNVEKERIRGEARRKTDAENIKIAHDRWVAANPEKNREHKRKWDKAHPENRLAYKARRRAKKLNATPLWADQETLLEIYAKARAEGMEVDHIVPLSNPMVCGLHVPDNLQLLTGSENRKKGNRFPWEMRT